MADGIFIGSADGGERQVLDLSRANRHGLIAGATGTGKTVTLQSLAEDFSRAGVPVFLADVKGDLSGIAMPGSPTARSAAALEARAAELGVIDYAYEPAPAVLWDLWGEQGHPVRTTVSEMGPLLLARLLDLNDTQEGVLNIVFRFADEEGLLLLDMADLRAMLAHAADNAKELSARYGNVTRASVGAIQRQLLALESQGGDMFFGEPALEIEDFIAHDEGGRGIVNVLAADRLMRSPRLYATFLLWLLAELFEVLPEVGDLDRPKLVFFFDEAHLLFTDANPALLQTVEQVVRLIRSKGVGVYFVTQNPIDIPEKIAGQLGNRVQHALRAFTPRDQKAIRAAAETFRTNPALNVATAIAELKVGEALVSTLLPDGAPSMVQRTKIKPPRSRLGPLTPEERTAIRAASPIGGCYDRVVDRESAAEVIAQKAADAAATAQEVAERGEAEVMKRERKSPSIWGKAAKSAAGAAASSAGAIAAGAVSGRRSRASPMKNAATNGLGSIAGDLMGPLAGRFVRNLIGGLMR
ncbi:helicase HerA-like domain-containing protein [Croceibacterium sp. TMG7-5b_MA50]|uniref:helicase HerA-like domain-containing protein n=1 Tax=Croceibacterium sp. TMG7-5b_MA50 TaxID=3121290 RepID=UPI003221E23A